MKKIVYIVFACLCPVIVLAETITQKHAQQIGLAFLASIKQGEKQSIHGRANTTADIVDLSANGLPNLYLLNSTNGWVIMSNDTRVQPILAYSATRSALDINNIPEGMADLLSLYNDEIRYMRDSFPEVEDHPQWQQISLGVMNTSEDKKVIERCAQVLWGQNSNNDNGCKPAYNMLCPSFYSVQCNRTIVGCVAVAMAQIMWYYKWPLYATLVPDTISIDGVPSSNVHSQWYDWDLMPSALHKNTPNAESSMIATLLRDCGYTVEMKYGPKNSRALPPNAMKALKTVFGYSGDMSFEFRKDYSQDDSKWIQKIKAEIDADRPVLYTGYLSNGNGHTFVIDGYHGQWFHLNWGFADSITNDAFCSLDRIITFGMGSPLSYSQQAIFGIEPAITHTPAVISGLQTTNPLIRITCGNITLNNTIIPATCSAHIYSGTQVRLTGDCKLRAGCNAHIAIKDLPCGDYSVTKNAPTIHKSPSIENKEDATNNSSSTTPTQRQINTTIDHIAVYSISGQLLQTIYGADADFSSLPSGFYVLQKHMTDGCVVSETIAHIEP